MAESVTDTLEDDADIDQELIASVGKDVVQPVVDEDEDDDTPAAQETKDDETTDVAVEPAAEGDVQGDDAAAPADASAIQGTAGDPPAAPGSGGADAGGEVPPSVQPAAAGSDAAKPVKQPQQQYLSPAQARLQELETAILAEDFDPYSADGRKLQLEHNRVAAYVAAEPMQVENYWLGQSVTHQLPKDKLISSWQDIQGKYAKKYPGLDPQAWQIAAAEEYERTVASLKAARKTAAAATPKPGAVPATTKGTPVKPPAAPTPITTKGARIAPPAAVVPPPPKAKSDEEELVESVRKDARRHRE